MKLLIIVVFTLSTVLASPGKEPKLRNVVTPAGRPDGRVYKGQKARYWQFPYQAAILRETEKSREWCGGSVIGNRWILTTAHCTDGAINATIYLGSTVRRTSPVKHYVTQRDIIIHPEYNPRTYENDISLIEIPFTGFYARIQSVGLPPLSKSNSTYVGEEAIVTGWGRHIKDSRKMSRYLLWGSMEVISNADCAKIYRGIIPSQICTASTDGANTCKGDSGGPVVLRRNKDRIQVGITWAGGNCVSNPTSVNIRVDNYVEWIKDITGIYY